MNPKINMLINLALGMTLTSMLALGAKCPIADSITAGLALMTVLTLMDIRWEQSQ